MPSRFVVAVGIALSAIAGIASTAHAGVGITYVNETGDPEEADLAYLLEEAAEFHAGFSSPTLRALILEAGVTEPDGPDEFIYAQVGYGPLGSDPRFSVDWTWTDASFEKQAGYEDQYSATVNIPLPGQYSYTFRFSIDAGATWTLADLNGAGSIPDFDFELSNLGVLTVLDMPVVIDFANFKNRTYEQTSPAAPTAALYYAGDQRIFGYSLVPDTVGVAQVTFPGKEPPVVLLDTFAGGFFVMRYLDQQPTEAGLDLLVPPGTYTFDISGGLLGVGSGTIDQPVTNLWSNIAYFENYAAIQGAHAGVELFFDYNTPVIDPFINDGGVFWGVFDPIAFQYVAFGNAPFSAPSNFTVPANALVPARRYEVEITFSTRTVQGTGSDAFVTAVGFTAWDSITRLTFRTAPACPGDANGDHVVNFTDITTVLASFGNTYGANTGPGDANGDGAVTFIDITTVLANFGNSCL